MLGLINLALEFYVVDTFGEDTWAAIKQAAGLQTQAWVSVCPYSDAQTYG